MPRSSTTYAPGQSGNLRGRHGTPRGERLFHWALLRAIEKADGNEIKLDKIARALVNQAIKGDVSAIKEVADRLDGKVPQPVANADGSNVPMVLVVRWGDTPHPLEDNNNIEHELPMLELKANGNGPAKL